MRPSNKLDILISMQNCHFEIYSPLAQTRSKSCSYEHIEVGYELFFGGASNRSWSRVHDVH